MRAVCLSCGALKWGALTACRECGVRPATPEEQGRALAASEDHFDADGLAALAERVRAGGAVDLDADLVAELSSHAASVRVPPLGFVLMVVGVPFAVAVVLGVLAIALLAG
ncbi:MAG: hypothetical protein R3F61_35075 [Myxococcota bacterium]